MLHPLISATQSKFAEVVSHLEHELQGIRTGIAHPGLVENVLVESYGSRVPLKTVATISVAGKASIVIQPWDKNIVRSIVAALQEANLGALPVSDGHTVRLSIPSPTEEQRKDLCKKVHECAERSRIAMRTTRSDTHTQLRKMRETSAITEDDYYQLDKDLQKVVDTTNKMIDERVVLKEKDIMTI